jgi:hypothetical protein
LNCALNECFYESAKIPFYFRPLMSAWNVWLHGIANGSFPTISFQSRHFAFGQFRSFRFAPTYFIQNPDV